MGIGRRIKEAREMAGLTQEELGRLVGVTGSAITNYEKETSHPKEPVMYALIEALNVDANFLFQDCVKNSKALEVTPEAMKIAKQYDDLDDYGKETMEYVVNRETNRVREIRRLNEQLGTEASSDFPSAFILLSRSKQPASAGTGMFLGSEDFETIYVRDNPLIRRASFGVPISGDSMEPEYHDGDTLLVEAAGDICVGEVGVFTLDGQGYVKERGKDTLISYNPEYAPIPMDESVRCNGRVIGILDPDWIVEK